MDRQAKRLQGKQKTHEVRWPNDVGQFPATVISGNSGTFYTITETGDGLRCNCKWAKYNPSRPCTHILALHSDLEVRNEGRPGILSFWSTPEAAQRQHRPTLRIGEGLWATSRLAR
jgi:hypothetical protein